MIGRTISHYKILEKLGEGGMGVVYKAEDTQLRRIVALKFLSTETVGNEEVKARLIREAQASASLDHPNICQVFGIHEEHGQTFIAMAFIDGPALAGRITERPLPLGEVLSIAIQIAEGLQEAHEKGIVHRDIKPQNVMLTAKGQVKIMDFGLASLAGRSKLTKSGTTLGTPAYMAPEQLEAAEVDRRADIWALGCVLYEMLTQRTPFDADYEQAIAYGILNEAPEPVTAQRRGLPAGIDDLLLKALAKDPAARYQHADDMVVDLRGLKRSPTPKPEAKAVAGVSPIQPKSRAPLMLAALALFTAGVALAWFWGRSGQELDSRSYHLELRAPPGVAYTAFSLSPDGSSVAFIGEGVGAPRLWVQSLVDHTARSIEGSENAEPLGTPFWSPDGMQIGFFADGKLKRVSVEGGGVQTVCDAPFGRGGSWSESDLIVFAPSNESGLWRAHPTRGGCDPLIERATGPSLRSPQFLPPGDRLLFTGQGLQAASLSTPDRTGVSESPPHASYIRSAAMGDQLLYEREGSLWARSFEVEGSELSGSETLIARNVGFDPMLQRGLFSAAGGVLTYLPEGAESRARELGWFDREGEPISPVTGAETFGFTVDLSPDEEWALFCQVGFTGRQQGVTRIRRLDLSNGIATAIAEGVSPASPNGEWIFYTSADGLAVQSPSGGSRRIIVRAGEDEASIGNYRKFFCDLSPGSSLVAYQNHSLETGWDLWTVPLSGGEPQALLNEPFDEGQAKLSPDGRWIAYVSNESGSWEVYARTFPSGERKARVSLKGGRLPRWRSDGSEVFYVDETGMLMVVTVESTGETLRFGRAQPLFPVSSGYTNRDNYLFAPAYTYDVSQDGQRFLALWRPPGMPFPPLQVITNWESKLRRE